MRLRAGAGHRLCRSRLTAKLGLVAAGLGVTVVPGLALPSLPGTVAVVRIDDPAAKRTTAVAAEIRRRVRD